MYPGYLDSFRMKHPGIQNLPYNDHLNLLLNESTEFAASYLKNFKKLGLDAQCAIVNEHQLQDKWGKQYINGSKSGIEILSRQIHSFKPDVLWIENLSLVSEEFLRKIKDEEKSIRLIAATHCSPFNSKVLSSLKAVDLIIACTPGIKSSVESLGKRSFLVYHGFDPDMLKEISFESDKSLNDFTFSGSLISGGDFHARRINLIEKLLEQDINLGLYVNLEKKFKIRTKQSIYILYNLLKKAGLEQNFQNLRFLQYGKNKVDFYSENLLKHKKAPVYGSEMLSLFRHSRVVLNYHIGIAGSYAGNMRLFEVTGVGSCLLTDNKENMNELFDCGKEVVVYNNTEDCIEKARWLLAHEEERKQIAMAGQKRTLENHTVENRCRTITDIILTELNTKSNLR
jgi:spore maturation protein CgeB